MKPSLRSVFIRQMMIRRRPSGSQEGYVLITTLAGMVLCTIIISSLLAVTLSTISIEETGRTREKQNRAAEGAVDVAINQIRNSASTAASNLPLLKTFGDTGYDTTKKSNEQLPKVFDDLGYDKAQDPAVNPRLLNSACDPVYNLVNVEGTPVRIYCYNDGLSQYGPLGGDPVSGVPQDDGGVALRLVGDEYKGDPNPALDPLGATADKARLWKSQFPFSGAMQGFSQAEIDVTKGQLLYTGATPLKVTGGIEVKNQIAAVTEAGRSGPALKVDGFVAQGGPGMFDPETGTNGCGIAEPVDSAGATRADIQSASIYAAAGGALTCANPQLSVMGAGGLPPGNGDWNNARVQSTKYQDWDGFNGKFRQDNSGLYDVLNTDCERYNIGGGVISLPAGSYDSKATKTLNQWFGGGCPNRTFYFESGDYWFDVDDPALPESNPKKHSLVFGSYENNWVFGKRNWAGERPMNAEFPDKACLRTAPSPASPDGSSGVSITLSSRTGLNHSAGRVAICGPILRQAATTDPVPTQTTAIWQRPATSLGARLLPDTWSSVSSAPGFAGVADAPRLADRLSLKLSQDVSSECWVSGTCLFEKTFRLAGMGTRAADGADPGPGLLGSAWIDLTADADFANNPAQNLAYTKFALTLSDGNKCSMRFGTSNNALASRITDNYATTSYNLLDDPVADTSDGIDGDCDTVMTAANGVGREDLRNASIDVTVGLNPPKLENTVADRFLRGVIEVLLFFRNLFVNPDISSSAFFAQICPTTATVFRFFGRAVSCDTRPPAGVVSYSVDAVAVRLGWTPTFDTPTNEPSGLNGSFVNPANGRKEAVPAWTTVTNSIDAAQSSATQAKLNYTLKDPNLLDGFLPVRTLKLTAKMRKPAVTNAGDKVDFILKTTSGTWCTVTVPFTSITNNVEQTFDVDLNTLNTCRVGQAGAPVSSLEIGELVSHRNDPSPGTDNVFAAVQALVSLQNTSTSRIFELDYVTLQATAGDLDANGNTVGYPRPKDPFTVTWNPLTENKTYSNPVLGRPSPRIGDASFNVFGPVSVPNNDVRVIWNWNNTVDPPDDPGKAIAAGPTGFAIFNGGSVAADKCSPPVAEFCRPGLVASALGSWTTGTWPANPTVTQQPDALASTGATRFPFRSARIVACVLDEKGNADPADDELLPRLDAKVLIADKQGTAVAAGSKVSVIDWKILKNNPYKYGAAAAPDPCNIYG